MGALADLREQVAAVLVKVCEQQVEWELLPLPVDAVSPPVYMVEWSDPWFVARSTFCRYDTAIDVLCVAGRIDPDPNIALLEDMVEAAVVALDDATFPVSNVTPPRPIQIGGITYLAATITTRGSVALRAPAGESAGAVDLLTADSELAVAGLAVPPAPLTGRVDLAAAATLTTTGAAAAPPTKTGSVHL